MTYFDYTVIGIVAVSLILGLWRGVVGEVVALIAWVAGIMAAVEYGGVTGGAIFSGIADPAIRTLAGCTVVFVGVLLAMALVRIAVRSMVKALGLSLSDRLLGMLFGIARGALVVVLLVGLGGMTSAPAQDWWRQATLAPPLEVAVLAIKPWLPPDLAKRIRFS